MKWLKKLYEWIFPEWELETVRHIRRPMRSKGTGMLGRGEQASIYVFKAGERRKAHLLLINGRRINVPADKLKLLKDGGVI